MYSKSQSITVAGATTLLLAITGAITLVSCMNSDSEYKYSFTIDGHEITLWGGKPTYGLLLRELEPLSDSILDQRKEEHDKLAIFYKLLYVDTYETKDDICAKINVKTFFKLSSMYDRYKDENSHADILKYASHKFGPCALKLMQDFDEGHEVDLDKINEFFRVGLMIEKPLSPLAMSERVRNADLVNGNFNVSALIDMNKFSERIESFDSANTAAKSLVFHLDIALDAFRSPTRQKVNIVNVARGLGAIKEDEVKPKFHLINEYVRLAAQIEDKKTYTLIRENFMRQIHDSEKKNKA